MQLREGKQIRATKNCTSPTQGMIAPSVNNGYSTQSSRKLILVTLDLISTLVGL